MGNRIRLYTSSDGGALIDFSLRAWQPVFESMERVLGREIFVRLHGTDWREYQERSIRGALDDDAVTVWVAEEHGGHLAGFVAAAEVDHDRRVGEIIMLAVDPDFQRRGIGTALTEHATGWLAEHGILVAMIGTGGDPGHAAARRTYGNAEYTLFPMARYFKAL